MTIDTPYLRAKGVEALALRLRTWRRRQRLSQRELARVMGLSEFRIARFERGETKLRKNARELVENFLREPPPRKWV